MMQFKRPLWQTYGLAVLCGVLATAITETTVLKDESPSLLLFVAVIISAWVGGFGPGFVAAAIGLLASMYFTLGPTIPFRVATPEETIRLLLFALISFFIIWIAVIREQTEDRLRSQRGLLRVTLSSIGDAVIATDEKGNINFLNPVAQQLTGWKPEVIGKPLLDWLYIVNEKTGNPVEEPVSRVMREGTIVSSAADALLISQEGKRIPIDYSAAPIRDQAGKLVGVVLVFRDVSARRLAEDQIRESEERYRTVTQVATDAIITIDKDDKIVLVNPAAEKVFGYTAEEMLGQELTMLMRLEERDQHRTSMARYLETGEKGISWERIELQGLNKNGKVIPLEVSFGKFVRNGQPYFSGTIRDVTDRKQAEKRQAAQYAVTRALADSDSLKQAASKILQAICESSDWQIGVMWYIDREVDLLRCVDVWHVPQVDVDDFESLTREMLFTPGVGLPGRVWSSKSSAWIKDVLQDNNFPRVKVATKANLHGAFGFPILAGDEFTGVLEFFSQDIREPDQDLLGMMSVLGSQVGQFVERKRVEDALKLSREQQAVILSGVADGITAQDSKGRLIYANEAAAKLIGYASAQELLNANSDEILRKFVILDENGNPFPTELLPARLALTGQSPRPVVVRYRLNNSDDERWSLINAAAVRDNQGRIQFAVSIIHDITERRRADENLSRLAAIVESSEDAIISKTVEGTILTWNPAATSLYGYTPEEVVGKSVHMLYPPDYQKEYTEIRDRLRRGEPIPMHDTKRLRKDGTRLDVSMSISLIKDSAGNVVAASMIARDITERKRAEETERFFSDASRVLASSLNYGETLASIARLTVPQVADWCTIHIIEEGEVRQVAIAHADPEKVKLARDVQKRYPPDPNAPSGVYNVLRTGKTEYLFEIPPEMLARTARDPEQLQMLMELDLRSYIIAPLIARGRTLGAISFVSSGHRRYGPSDVALIEELAHRAALSVDNARLYREAQQLNEELEKRVIARTIELQNVNRNLEMESEERKRTAEQLRSLSAHLQSAREEERVRIAREIHDQLGQSLTAIKIDVSLLGKKLLEKGTSIDHAVLAQETTSTVKLIDETIQEMRHIIQELRPEILDHLGLGAAIDWQVNDFQTRTGIKCQYRFSIDDSELDLDRATAVFRILQESLTNVARHANANNVDIDLHGENGNLILQVRDDGKGFSENDSSPKKTFGILGMSERALAFGGTVEVHGLPNQGTVVTACIPVA